MKTSRFRQARVKSFRSGERVNSNRLRRGLLSKSICHVFNPAGHRSSYRDLMMDAFDMEGMVGAPRRSDFVALLLARQVLFATIDGSFRDFLVVSWLRSLRGAPTVGLFVGSTAMLKRGGRSRSTRALIRAMRFTARLPTVRIMTIIPHHICPELQAFDCDWIHDPQMWDLLMDEEPAPLPETELSERVDRLREGRSVVIFVGKASEKKGFPELVQFARAHHEEVLVVSGGLVQDECVEDAEALRSLGMVVEDRFLTDDEVLSLYRVGDFAWCCYRGLDQASGIFGRAVQTGVVPMIKSEGFLADYAEWYGLPCLVLDLGTVGDATDAFDLRPRSTELTSTRRQTLEDMRDLSLQKINEALEG